jgi:hypothetical protein
VLVNLDRKTDGRTQRRVVNPEDQSNKMVRLVDSARIRKFAFFLFVVIQFQRTIFTSSYFNFVICKRQYIKRLNLQVRKRCSFRELGVCRTGARRVRCMTRVF